MFGGLTGSRETCVCEAEVDDVQTQASMTYIGTSRCFVRGMCLPSATDKYDAVQMPSAATSAAMFGDVFGGR